MVDFSSFINKNIEGIYRQRNLTKAKKPTAVILHTAVGLLILHEIFKILLKQFKKLMILFDFLINYFKL